MTLHRNGRTWAYDRSRRGDRDRGGTHRNCSDPYARHDFCARRRPDGVGDGSGEYFVQRDRERKGEYQPARARATKENAEPLA
ncbi:MAG: hypothetical protein WAL67_09140 [Candidatus Cybelea sp.]